MNCYAIILCNDTFAVRKLPGGGGEGNRFRAAIRRVSRRLQAHTSVFVYNIAVTATRRCGSRSKRYYNVFSTLSTYD